MCTCNSKTLLSRQSAYSYSTHTIQTTYNIHLIKLLKILLLVVTFFCRKVLSSLLKCDLPSPYHLCELPNYVSYNPLVMILLRECTPIIVIRSIEPSQLSVLQTTMTRTD
jgi:hypothetical protein